MYLNDTGYDLLTKFLTMDPSQVRERRVGERREGRGQERRERKEQEGRDRREERGRGQSWCCRRIAWSHSVVPFYP